MHDLIETKRDALIALCQRYHVRRLELFGSALRDDFAPDSDLDLAVTFGDVPQGQHFRTYFGLLEDLKALFQRPVDLVMLSAARNPYFVAQVEADKVLLYDAA